MNNQKVKAFTLMELTVAMLISALVIGITYTSYGIIVKYYSSFDNKDKEMAVLASLDHVLKRDFERAETVLKDTSGIVIKVDSDVVKYEFAPDFIIRRTTRADTFKVTVQNLDMTFEQNPVNELQTEAEQNRVDELTFSLRYQNETIPYHYHKLYSSENLIQRNPNAIN